MLSPADSRPSLPDPPLPTQREIIRDVLLLAARYDSWLTLDEIARKTLYPPASISAQIRHLRKPSLGGYVIEKRRRPWQDVSRSSRHEIIWEYKVKV